MLDHASLRRSLQEYLDAALGVSISMRQWDLAKSVPLYLQELYALYSTELLGYACLLAIDRGSSRRTTAQTIADLQRLTKRSEPYVIYVAAALSSANRFRLVEAKVSFIVPGKQLYLAPLGIDFRKAYERPQKHTTEKLSPIAQLLVLQALHQNGIEQENPTQLAARLGYAKMSIGRAFNELEALELAEDQKHGKERHIHFARHGKELWDRALPYLGDPVKRKIFISDQTKTQHFLILAGETALAQYSNLNPQPYAVYAIHNGSLEAKELFKCRIDAQDGIGNYAELELWTYDPRLLSANGTVDKLSLYLSLREEKDERVQQAIEVMLRSMQW